MRCIRCEEVTEEQAAGALFLKGIPLPIPAVFCQECHEELVYEWGLLGLDEDPEPFLLVEDSEGIARFVPASSIRGFLQ
jgi:hypothetical protein